MIAVFFTIGYRNYRIFDVKISYAQITFKYLKIPRHPKVKPSMFEKSIGKPCFRQMPHSKKASPRYSNKSGTLTFF